MGDVINLNRYRKQRDQRRREQEAGPNRVRSGRTRAEVKADVTTRERARQALDGKKIDEPA